MPTDLQDRNLCITALSRIQIVTACLLCARHYAVAGPIEANKVDKAPALRELTFLAGDTDDKH